MNGCFNCAHQNTEKCKTCRTTIGEFWEHEVKTNFDCVKKMSVEEFAEMFKSPLFFNKPWCCLHEQPCRHLDSKEFQCAECLLNWLKQGVG